MSTEQKKGGTGCIVMAILIGCIVFVGLKTCTSNSETKPLTRSEQIEQLFSGWDGSHPLTVEYIKANIKDPDSYKHISTKYIDHTDYISVITEFTATNGFGGRVRTTCISKIDLTGKLLSADFIQ